MLQAMSRGIADANLRKADFLGLVADIRNRAMALQGLRDDPK
jgi:hypothetical protein